MNNGGSSELGITRKWRPCELDHTSTDRIIYKKAYTKAEARAEEYSLARRDLLAVRVIKYAASHDFSELNLPSLEHADIQFEDYDEFYILEEDWDIMLSGCHNVKSLTLCATIIEELCEISEFLEQRPSPFTRLEYLNLTNNPKSIPFKVVNYFFKGSSCASPRIEMI
ncbi:hypothetical protein LINPERPRIM_LOCUS39817 [Linum perenne]